MSSICRLSNFCGRFSEDVAEEYRARYRKMHNLVVTAHRAERDVSEVHFLPGSSLDDIGGRRPQYCSDIFSVCATPRWTKLSVRLGLHYVHTCMET